MPSLPTKINRRRGVTPTTHLHHDDVWERTFQVMGLEPLNSTSNNPSSISSEAPTMPVTAPSLAESSRKRKTIVDYLPAEALEDIFKLASTTDLVALSLVSKQFRDIAAKQLYRSFHIVFPDEDDYDFSDYAIDGLAGGLDTFVTSEYDYGQYLREIILETLSGGEKGERAYRYYHFNASCGKFMNTLLLLTLRKAKALETFKWDIRVELSREVFKALHKIHGLQHLHLRMQIGSSMYKAPPAIAPSSILFASNTVIALPPPAPPMYPPPNAVPLGSMPVPIYTIAPTPQFIITTTNKIAAKHQQRNSKPLLPTVRKVPPTLSDFKQLKSLAILDMDTLDYIGEIKECIEKSSSTLRNLKLSFSEELARKSRRPPPEIHSDDESDQEDEFGNLLIPPPGPPGLPSGAADPNGPSKVLKAQEERKKQEAALGKIFGIAPEKTKILPLEPDKKPVEDPKRAFIRNLAPVAKMLMSTIKDGNELSAVGQETLDLITKAARLFMESMAKTKTTSSVKSSPIQGAEGLASLGSSTAKSTPSSSTTASVDGAVEVVTTIEPGLFDKPGKKEKKEQRSSPGVSYPEDIDIEEPEEELEVEELPTSTEDENFVVANAESQIEISLNDVKKQVLETTEDRELNSSSKDKYTELDLDTASASGKKVALNSIDIANRMQLLANHSALHASHREITRDIATQSIYLQKELENFTAKSNAGTLEESDYARIADAEISYKRVATRLGDLNTNLDRMSEQIDELKDAEDFKQDSEATRMSDYVRSTRGLTLHNLSIYLIPIKASVLSKAIDVSVLQEITLLNVGQQIPFWNTIARENQISSVPLKKIHTDNVTLPFLTLVNQLDRVEELVLLERSQKHRVESTAPKTTITFDHIRRIVLKKHASTLKVLVIRNDNGTDWDLSVKGAILLCQRAKILEELAVSFGVRTMHSLLQFMAGLESLRVLHTIKLNADETGLWVGSQFRKFLVDNVSHNPAMKLEYIALDGSVERLVRRAAAKRAPVDRKGKGKEKTVPSRKTLAQLALASHTSWTSTSGIGVPNAGLDGLNLIPPPGWSAAWDESDDDDLDVGGKMGLKIETLEGIRASDITNVRIFEKEIVLGRL